jgi:hypothetical protein
MFYEEEENIPTGDLHEQIGTAAMSPKLFDDTSRYAAIAKRLAVAMP